MSDQQTRHDLEQKIIQKEWEFDASLKDLSWLYSEPFNQLLDAWHQLVQYYESHGDDEAIGVEAIRSYVHMTRMLRNIMLNPDMDSQAHKKAEEMLISFEGMLENIIREVVSYQDTTRYQPNS